MITIPTDVVVSMRRLYGSDGWSAEEIAAVFRVHRSTVTDVLHGYCRFRQVVRNEEIIDLIKARRAKRREEARALSQPL